MLSVNGVEHKIANPSPSLLLSDYLRHDLGLTGTKVGCLLGIHPAIMGVTVLAAGTGLAAARSVAQLGWEAVLRRMVVRAEIDTESSNFSKWKFASFPNCA